MKLLKFIVLFVFCAFPLVSGGQVATTAGSNLTAWNGDVGATNNNNWNSMMNARAPGGAVNTKPTADFGNCNSLILRCAQPKCTGCTSMELARPIVTGCVNDNKTCKKHGNDLIEAISAQLVAGANTKIQEQQLQAQQAAAAQAAAQSNVQIQQMQQQMQQMQYDMQQQNREQMDSMQALLDEQKALVVQAQAEAAAAQQAKADFENAQATSGSDGLTGAQRDAIAKGADADMMARLELSGQIMSEVENAEQNLKNLKLVMDEIFKYAGCDMRGNNCTGPKRVKIFKQKANGFFQPYEDIIDQIYDALQTALAAGVDITDVIMMMNGGCNRWGKYMCRYSDAVDYKDGKLVDKTYDNSNCQNGRSIAGGVVRGGQSCREGTVIPPQDDIRCTQIGILDSSKEVQREWINENDEEDGLVRVGCATSALDSIQIFGTKNKRSAAMLDLDILQQIILQDSPAYGSTNRFTAGMGSGDDNIERTKYCGLTTKGYQELLTAINTDKLPSKICVKYDSLETIAITEGYFTELPGEMTYSNGRIINTANKSTCDAFYKNWAKSIKGCNTRYDDTQNRCYVEGPCKFDGTNIVADSEYKTNCEKTEGVWKDNYCVCRAGYLANQMTIDGKCIKIGSVEEEKIKCEAKDNHYWNDYYNDCRCRDGYKKESGNCVMTDAAKEAVEKALKKWGGYEKPNSSTEKSDLRKDTGDAGTLKVINDLVSKELKNANFNPPPR